MYDKIKDVLRKTKIQIVLALYLCGPGLLVMIADNDVGGITTYAVTGSKFGFSLLWIFIILLPMAYWVQSLTVKLGCVTGKGHAEAIFSQFGQFWGWFSLADLAIVNFLTLITEYIGMTTAMSLLGVPPVYTYIGVTILLFGVVVSGKYLTFERIALFFCLFNFVYIPAAIWGMNSPTSPGWDEALKGFYNPTFPSDGYKDLVFIILANIGTTIAPWQIFFQQSAVVDKGLGVKDIPYGKVDTWIGSFLTCLVAVFIILATAATMYYHDPRIIIEDAAQAAQAIVPLMPLGYGELAKKLFAIGLFDAGLLGALCISLASSWAIGEVFGWDHSLNKHIKEAPWFYLIYLAMLVTAGGVVFIPNAPLVTITMFVQVIAVTLLPSTLVFLVLILNNKEVMGDYANTLYENITNWSIIVLVIIMSSLLGIQTLFPEWTASILSKIIGG